jgi:predicted nucleotidyltransferase
MRTDKRSPPEKCVPMKSKLEILRILKRELPLLKVKYKVSKIALFGSYVRGEQKKKSDIDVLVEFEAPVGYFKFIELEEYLSSKLGTKVDLVTPDALKSLIKPSIMGEAVYA